MSDARERWWPHPETIVATARAIQDRWLQGGETLPPLYDSEAEALARAALVAAHEAEVARRAPAVEEAEPRVFPNGDYYAAPAGTECPTCGDTGIDPTDPFHGDPSGMDANGNLIYSHYEEPCPTCSPNETSER